MGAWPDVGKALRIRSRLLAAPQASFESLLWNIIGACDHVRATPGSFFAALLGSLDAPRSHLAPDDYLSAAMVGPA